MALRHVRSVVKHYSDIEKKVKKATSNDPWGPSSSLMGEIADATYNVTAFSEIMGMIWKRLNDSGKNWRHVYKSLTVLEYIVKTGSERVAQQCRENIFAIQTLKDFQHIDVDGKDQGMNVREKSKQLVSLLKDEDRLKNERQRALKAKERFAQSSGGVGNTKFKGNKRFGNSPGTLSTDVTTTQDDSSIPSSRSWEVDKPTEFDRRSADGRYTSDLEKARPSNEAEEEMQLQIAIAMSKEQADQEKKLRQGDDERFKMALRESQHGARSAPAFLAAPPKGTSQPAASTLLDLSEPSPQVEASFQPNLDPWGAPEPHVSAPVPDPWSSQPNPSVLGASDPWGTSHPHTEVGANSDPWGHGTETAGVRADPWDPSPASMSNASVLNGLSTPQDVLTNGFDPRSTSVQPPTTSFANPFDLSAMNSSLPPTQGSLEMEPKSSFLGETARLVNLDNILGSSSSSSASHSVGSNPFAVSAVPKSTNPFMQDKPKPKSINELRVEQTSFSAPAQQNLIGGDVLLPAPLIPDSTAGGVSTQNTNPFM